MKIYLKKVIIFLLLWGFSYSTIMCGENGNGWDAEYLDFDDDPDGLNLDDIPDDLELDIDAKRLPVLPPGVEGNFYLANVRRPLWNKSFSPRGRDALYLIPYKLREPNYNGLLFNLFYNETSRIHITAGTALNLDLDQEQEATFVNLLGGNWGADNAEEFATLAHLLKKLSVTERKSGFLMNGGFSIGALIFGLDTSVHLSERNIITSKKDEKRIKEIVANNFGDGAMGEIDLKGELARQLIGLGDTRLKFGVKAIDFKDLKINLGASVIFPTATGLLLDGHFKKPKKSDFHGFGDEIEKVRNIFLSPELGSNGHFGFGLFLETKLSLYNDWMNIWSRLVFDDFIPSREKRQVMFKNRITPQQLEKAIDDEGDGNITEEELRVKVTEFRRQYLAPMEIEAAVNPGSVFMYTIFFDWKLNERWKFGVGYDFYSRQREEIEKIYKSTDPNIGSNIDMADLGIGQAENDTAVQHKISTEVSYDIKLKHSRLNVGIGGDYTVMREGIGRDWTVYSKLGWKF